MTFDSDPIFEGLKDKIEGLVLRFELLANCAEAYEKLCRPGSPYGADPVREEHWRTEKETTAYHARILRQDILGWSQSVSPCSIMALQGRSVQNSLKHSLNRPTNALAGGLRAIGG